MTSTRDPRVHRRLRRVLSSIVTVVPTAALAFGLMAAPAAGSSLPSGEHILGQSSIEPAYNADTGQLMYLLTPIKSPFPTHTSAHALGPLYIVEYPPSTTVGTLNCMGVPGNCPDHDGLVAQVATQAMPSVYGSNPSLVPGHDHIADPPGGADFDVAWEVVEVLFTNSEAANTHLTTDAAIQAAIGRGDAIPIDLGFAFHCSVVSATTYWTGH